MTKMAIDFAPYAPPTNILKIIKDYRDGVFTWPTVLNKDEIMGLGVPESGAGRVFQTFEFLKFVDSSGKRTEVVDTLDRVPDDQYPGVIASIVRQAYGKSVECVTPTYVNKDKVIEEFRRFKSVRLRKRMVGLFLALCEEAELVPKGTTRQRVHRVDSGVGRTPRRQRAENPEKVKDDQKPEINGLAAALSPGDHWVVSSSNLIADTIRRLPKERSWSRDERTKWLNAFVGNLDFEVTVDSEKTTAS